MYLKPIFGPKFPILLWQQFLYINNFLINFDNSFSHPLGNNLIEPFLLHKYHITKSRRVDALWIIGFLNRVINISLTFIQYFKYFFKLCLIYASITRILGYQGVQHLWELLLVCIFVLYFVLLVTAFWLEFLE